MASFETVLTLNCAGEMVFDFLIQPANVLKILPPEAGVNYLDVPERLELGSRLEFELTGIGPVQRVIHEVIEFRHPQRFTEKQVKGPLKRFEHQHIVESADNGKIRIIDRIEFEPPGGLAGFLITETRILDSLEEGFDHRHRELKRILEEG